jgi:SAM-dependent methyltransferase
MSGTFDERDKHFLKWREANPGKSYAQYQTGNGLRSLERGDDHATLGPKLRRYGNWWDAGTATFARLQRLSNLREDSRVLDYGCGSLRIGGHFIRYLRPEHYFGLDVTDGFYEMGKDLIGAQMMADKRPRFAVIGEASLADGAAFGADIVISSAVSYHVHPTETAIYYGNLQRLAARPGARLLFDASISDVPLRNKSWCWPLDFYVQSLPELRFVGMDGGRLRDEGANFAMGVLQFERAP